MECVIYREGSGEAREVDCGQAADAGQAVLENLRDLAGEEFGWVRLDAPSERDMDRLTEGLGLHPLAVEDAVQAHQRPKWERYGELLAVALKTLWYLPEEVEVETGEMMLFLGPRFVVTVRHGGADPAAEAARRLAADPTTLRFGPAAVLHAVLDVVVDAYSDAADKVRRELTGLERCVFSPSRDDVTEDIYSLKREVLEFRDAVQPLVPVVRELFDGPHVRWPEDLQPYLRDVADHLYRTDIEVRSLDELLNSVLDAQLARVGTWQNDDMRRISAWAAILAIPTMIAGVYGMNFQHMPELGWAYGYPLAVGGMALLSGFLYRAFRRSGWL
ncbi:magnesium transporter CorA [Streptomyces carminius]|uniref:Magnesium transporter CorA n=1 Tax=Streptomyces carminius TaxID=2665496 RepID=A0A2M8LU50_9ACTN|nr:magnesium and cobalt transport protein CorA [Streptomyces carminius]PJE95485.1 magnesium transporter CorA [Streptomyces carminius]